MRGRRLGVLIVLLALSGCADSDPKAPDLEPVAKLAPGVKDCGVITVAQGEKVPASATACFVETVQGGHAARLIVTQPTTEGDPIVVTYSAAANGRIKVDTDTRADQYGTGRIEHQICTGATAKSHEIDFDHCEPA